MTYAKQLQRLLHCTHDWCSLRVVKWHISLTAVQCAQDLSACGWRHTIASWLQRMPGGVGGQEEGQPSISFMRGV